MDYKRSTLDIQVTWHSSNQATEHEPRRSRGQQRLDKGLGHQDGAHGLRRIRARQQRSSEDDQRNGFAKTLHRWQFETLIF